MAPLDSLTGIRSPFYRLNRQNQSQKSNLAIYDSHLMRDANHLVLSVLNRYDEKIESPRIQGQDLLR